jgi:type I restriction-modification system DNA methylase subunit
MTDAANQQFNKSSILLTKQLSKDVKKSQGIYFTPHSISHQLVTKALSYLHLHLPDTPNISFLEPSCGSCEIICAIDSLNFSNKNVSITGIELNTDVYKEISTLTFKHPVELINADFISIDEDKEYDAILGNPPYFVCKKEMVPAKYGGFIVGRPNMFGVFILHSLAKLKLGGILAFVIPKSFLNSMYYAKIRNYIKQTCCILAIDDYKTNNDFLDTKQATFGLIIQKLKSESSINESSINECIFSLRLNGNFIFTPDAEYLKTFFENSTTIQQLGLAVKTGPIVWNENKDRLTNDETQTILLYNTNVTNENKIKLTTFKNNEKTQYINTDGTTEPVIVVNRGNGNASYKFKYALVDRLMPFVVENHLNIIYSPQPMEKNKLINIYKQVIRGFENPKTEKFIDMFFGNNGLSKTELETIVPIYL